MNNTYPNALRKFIQSAVSRLTILLLCSNVYLSAQAEESLLIRNATIHTVSNGSLKNSDLLINNGLIQALGPKLANPQNVRELDASNKHITPGLFDAYNQLGLREVNAVDHSNDHSVEEYDLTAGFHIRYGINPNSSLIPIAAVNGVTHALVTPTHGDDIFAGKSSVLHLNPSSAQAKLSGHFTHVSLGRYGSAFTGKSRSAAIIRFEQALSDAMDYKANKSNYQLGKSRSYLYNQQDLEALIPAAEGRETIIVKASRESDIRLLISLKQKHQLNLVIYGAEEAWRLAAELAESAIPVIINSLNNLPSSFDQLGSRRDNAAILNKAGVIVLLGTDSSHNSRLIRQQAGNAVANGMPWQEALKAITLNPAHTFKVDDNYGSIAKGKKATIVIWDGDPLEITSLAEQVMIDGNPINMESRQTKLRDRYKNIKLKRPFAYQK